MGKSTRKIESVKRLETLWEEYKAGCDNHKVNVNEFSQKQGDFVSKKLNKAITYTIEGFCVFVGISRTRFYENYAGKEPWSNTVTRMREECEIDARQKFETGQIPSQLSGLWMSRHGYGTISAETEPSNLVDEWVREVIDSDEKS